MRWNVSKQQIVRNIGSDSPYSNASWGGVRKPRADDLLVELPDARLWNGFDEMNAIGNDVLRDHAFRGEFGDVVADHGLGWNCRCVSLHYHERNRALTPLIVRDSDHRDFSDAPNP